MIDCGVVLNRCALIFDGKLELCNESERSAVNTKHTSYIISSGYLKHNGITYAFRNCTKDASCYRCINKLCGKLIKIYHERDTFEFFGHRDAPHTNATNHMLPKFLS